MGALPLSTTNPMWKPYVDFMEMGGADLLDNQACVLVADVEWSEGVLPAGTQGIYYKSTFKLDGEHPVYAFRHDRHLSAPTMVTVGGVRYAVGMFLKGL